MADLKQKFIDILFEEDEDKEFDDEVYGEEVKASKHNDKSPIRAQDILYHKSSSSPFVNLNENKQNSTNNYVANNNINTNDEYEMSSQISPIFGVIKENKKKVINVDKEIIESQTSKPLDAHLDIITSPIYGYGNKEDAQDNNYDVKGIVDDNDVQEEFVDEEISSEDDELHHLFDVEDEQYLNNSYDSLDSKALDDEEISLFRLFGENK